MHCGFGNLWNFDETLRFSNESSGEKDKLTAASASSATSDSTTSTTTFDLSTVIYNHGCSPARFVEHIAKNAKQLDLFVKLCISPVYCIILYKFSIKQYEASQCKHVVCLHNSVGSFIQRQYVRWVKVIPTCFHTIRSAHVTRHFEAQSPT